MKIGSKKIGINYPTYFIADIAANHDGDLNRAVDLIHLCAEAGADVAKFQHFNASEIVSDYGFRELSNVDSHQSRWKKSVFETYQDASVPADWTEVLIDECRKAKIDFFSSPYDFKSVDMLNAFDVQAHKIGSGDITWHQIIHHIGKSKKPVFIATGASTLTEVESAISILRSYDIPICVMQCNTNYTADKENFKFINLNVLNKYKSLFPDLVLGLSDHTPGYSTVLGAVTLGARAIEKHFTDSNDRNGPDHKFSLNPKVWKEMVDRTRELELSLGEENKKIENNEKETSVLQRRCIRLNKDLKKDHCIKEEDITFLRPAPIGSIKPYEVENILNKELKKNKSSGDFLKYEDFK